jgi:Tfp pilus assembly protein PilN
MFKKIAFDTILKSKSAAGLEIMIMPDGSYQYHLIVLRKKQSTLLTELQRKEVTSIAEIKQLIDPKIPLVLIVNGKGIVHRKVHAKETDTPAVLLNKLLPNAIVDDFVIQRTPVIAEESIVSVIRVNSLTDLISQLIENQLTSVSACFLGPFVLTTVLPLLDRNAIDNDYLHIGNFRLKIQEHQIVDLEPAATASHDEIQIGNDQLSPQLIIPFAGALAYFTGHSDNISNADVLHQLKEEFKQKTKFEVRGWSLLVAAFFILIVNYLVFSNYWEKNKQMTAELQLTQIALQRYEKLKKEFDQKRLFLEQNGLLENSRTSYYADELAKELPASVQFTGLDIHPVKKKKPTEEDKGFSFENKLIQVSGNCQRNTELNEWMKKIKKKSWVEELVLLNYRQDNMQENGLFLIEIKLK